MVFRVERRLKGSENVIPKRRTHAPAGIMSHEMVLHMTLFKLLSEASPRLKMVNTVMNVIVTQIAQEKSRKKRVDVNCAQERAENQKKHDSKRDAHNRRHDQTGGVYGVEMMNAVDQKLDALLNFSFRMKVKNKTMHEVLSQRPRQNSERENASDNQKVKIFGRAIEKKQHERTPKNEGDQRMDMSQFLHPIALENTDAFIRLGHVE